MLKGTNSGGARDGSHQAVLLATLTVGEPGIESDCSTGQTTPDPLPPQINNECCKIGHRINEEMVFDKELVANQFNSYVTNVAGRSYLEIASFTWDINRARDFFYGKQGV